MEYNVKYQIGYPGWDKPETVKIIVGDTAIRIYAPYSKKEVLIQGKDIIDISFESQSKRSGARAATGALIGGVLTGGIGLLAGAAIGAKAKDKSEITLLFNEGGQERIMVLLTKKQTNAVFNSIVNTIEKSKNNPSAVMKSDQLKSNIENMSTGSKVAMWIFYGCMIVVLILMLKACFS